MIDLRQLKQLIKLMVDNDLTEMHLRDQEEQITMKRGSGGVPMVTASPVQSVAAAPALAATVATATSATGAGAPEEDDEAELIPIMSPMVGTFYGSPSPDAEAFVRVGSRVGPSSNVCIIEAMKVFNEIKAEVSGTIERVLVQSGQAVDCDTKLFMVRPE